MGNDWFCICLVCSFLQPQMFWNPLFHPTFTSSDINHWFSLIWALMFPTRALFCEMKVHIFFYRGFRDHGTSVRAIPDVCHLLCPTCNPGGATDWLRLENSVDGNSRVQRSWEGPGRGTRSPGKCRVHCGWELGGAGSSSRIYSDGWPKVVILLAKHQKYWKE